ncbi:MAG: GDP-mannose 4,6-dehydratase [Methylococcus sp.]|nr:GDP-mannose 4,6-dehydratase [Methylococcus sp.]
MRQSIFITGQNGFVGRHLRALLEQEPWRRRFRLLSPKRPYDLTDRSSLVAALAEVRPQVVVHLGAQSHVPTSFANPKATFDVNFLGTLNLLESLADTDFHGRMLFIGSADVYGLVHENELPVMEAHHPHPRNPYAVSKLAAEALCFQWSLSSRFEIVMTRPFNHIGPGQSEGFVVSGFAKQIVEIQLGIRRPEVSVGDIDVTRDFTDVRDIVVAYLLLLNRGRNGEIYNVGSGKEVLIRHALSSLMGIAGVDAKIVCQSDRMRPAEQRRMRCCVDKLSEETGWMPRVPWDQTLRDVLNYWKLELKQ